MVNQEKFALNLMRLFESKLKTFTTQTIEVWYQELKNYPEEKVFESINKLIKSSDAFISVGKIIDGFDFENTMNAWQRCLDSARSGGYKNLYARDVRALNLCGGFTGLMNASDREIVWIKKEFLNVYKDINQTKSLDFVQCLGLHAEILPDDFEEVKKLNG